MARERGSTAKVGGMKETTHGAPGSDDPPTAAPCLSEVWVGTEPDPSDPWDEMVEAAFDNGGVWVSAKQVSAGKNGYAALARRVAEKLGVQIVQRGDTVYLLVPTHITDRR